MKPSQPIRAVHGGSFFKAIGEDLRDLSVAPDVISADVLDAWYDPSPNIIRRIQEHLPWLIKTSPPTHGDGLRRIISGTRGVPIESIVLGSGTFALLYLALPDLLVSDDALIIFDPSYGEYAHVGQNVIGCQVETIPLSLQNFKPSVSDIVQQVRVTPRAKMLAIVNPNSPTGVALSRNEVEEITKSLPAVTIWIDETYIDFFSYESGSSQSVESLVRVYPNLIVCKSMSKFYALSGLRIGYLVANEQLASKWETHSPPWSIGLLAQLAGIEALLDGAYYSAKAEETRLLRLELEQRLSELGLRVTPSCTNFLLFRADENFSAKGLVEYASQEKVFLRDCQSLSPRFKDNAVRVAVKSAAANRIIIDVIRKYLE